MKKLFALILVLCTVSAAVAMADAVFTAPANGKGFNTLDPDKSKPNRVYDKAGDPLNLAKAMDKSGFVVKEAGSDAVLEEFVRTFAVEAIYMVLPSGEKVKVADEAMQDVLDLIKSRTVRIVKKGNSEGVSLNVEPYSRKKHTATYEIYFVGVGGGRHLTEYVRKDGVYTFCTKGKGSSSSSSGSEPEVTEAPPTTKPTEETGHQPQKTPAPPTEKPAQQQEHTGHQSQRTPEAQENTPAPPTEKPAQQQEHTGHSDQSTPKTSATPTVSVAPKTEHTGHSSVGAASNPQTEGTGHQSQSVGVTTTSHSSSIDDGNEGTGGNGPAF